MNSGNSFFRKGRKLRALCGMSAQGYGGGSYVAAGEELVVAEGQWWSWYTGDPDEWIKFRRVVGTDVDSGKPAWDDVFIIGPKPDDFEPVDKIAEAESTRLRRWWQFWTREKAPKP